jgi:hypothetical protein
MQIQALPFGHKANITGTQKTLELVSDGKVDYFEETYYDQPNDSVDLRLEQGVRDFEDPRLKKGLAAFAKELSQTGGIRLKTANRLARELGPEWKAQVYRYSGPSRLAVELRLGDPQRVSPQEMTFRSHGNKVDIRTFLPCEKLGAGSHVMSGACQADGSITDVLEYLTASG